MRKEAWKYDMYGNRKTPSPFSKLIMDPEYGIYAEDFFHESIIKERKRSERSKRRFLLMLIELEDVSRKNNAEKKLLRTVGSITRETDMKGWYRRGSVIGIIFTEIDGNPNAIRQYFEKKMGKAGAFNKSVKKVSMHIFPEKQNSGSCPFDTALYPEKLMKRPAKDILKRAVDIAGSIGAIILLSFFFAAIPLLIRLTSKGPALFRQTRIGQFGKPFTFLKFRSMRHGSDDAVHSSYVKDFISGGRHFNDEKGKALFKIKDDPRVTAIGKFLRKTSLDELPQFINVLKGEMSLVGPRPPIPYELESYEPWHMQRVSGSRPGITGVWQVKGRSRTTFDEMARMDISYIRNRNLWLDLKLLAMTPLSMFTNKGAY